MEQWTKGKGEAKKRHEKMFRKMQPTRYHNSRKNCIMGNIQGVKCTFRSVYVKARGKGKKRGKGTIHTKKRDEPL